MSTNTDIFNDNPSITNGAISQDQKLSSSPNSIVDFNSVISSLEIEAESDSGSSTTSDEDESKDQSSVSDTTSDKKSQDGTHSSVNDDDVTESSEGDASADTVMTSNVSKSSFTTPSKPKTEPTAIITQEDKDKEQERLSRWLQAWRGAQKSQGSILSIQNDEQTVEIKREQEEDDQKTFEHSDQEARQQIEEVKSLIGGLQKQINELTQHIDDLETGDEEQLPPTTEPTDIRSPDHEKPNDLFILDRDTFTMMMRSRVMSQEWGIGILLLISQISLMVLICLEGFSSSTSLYGEKDTPLGIPMFITHQVRLAQLFSIPISILAQQDIVSSLLLLQNVWWDEAAKGIKLNQIIDGNDFSETDRPTFNKKLWRFFIPTLLKLFKGLLVFVTSIFILIRSDEVFALLRDLIILVIFSKIDHILFYLAEKGCITLKMRKKAKGCKLIEIKDTLDGIALRGIILFLISAIMFIIFVIVRQAQVSGGIMRSVYPDCLITNDTVPRLGNGRCDDELNIEVCGFDDNDCSETIIEKNHQTCDAEFANRLGDGHCDIENYTPECDYDGHDCPFLYEAPGYEGCLVPNPMKIGDGYCDGYLYDTENCQNDGGDCLGYSIQYIAGYPGCFAFLEWIGDGVCNPRFNTTVCGSDGGDCIYPAPEPKSEP